MDIHSYVYYLFAVPECSPVVTNIQAASSTSINVAWQQDSTCLNGMLRGYIIQYRVLGNSTAHSINITDDRLTADRNVSGLRKYTNYSFRILAYTIGEGPLSKASVIKTGEDGRFSEFITYGRRKGTLFKFFILGQQKEKAEKYTTNIKGIPVNFFSFQCQLHRVPLRYYQLGLPLPQVFVWLGNHRQITGVGMVCCKVFK